MVVDTSARTADTLYVIGALQAYEPPPLQCSDTRPPNNVSPAIVVPYAAPPGADLRELLDGGGAYRLNVLVTDNANVIAYAARRANYLVVALPWSVTYVLVTSRATPVIGSLTAGMRDAIARNALTADARGAAEPFPWLTDSACAIAAVPMDRAGQVIGYPEGNATAQELAERMVSLAGAHGGTPWVATALADSALGGVAAAVRALDRDPRSACTTAGNARVPAGAIPLVDTRAHAIVRRGSGAAFVIGANGDLYFYRQSAR